MVFLSLVESEIVIFPTRLRALGQLSSSTPEHSALPLGASDRTLSICRINRRKILLRPLRLALPRLISKQLACGFVRQRHLRDRKSPDPCSLAARKLWAVSLFHRHFQFAQVAGCNHRCPGTHPHSECDHMPAFSPLATASQSPAFRFPETKVFFSHKLHSRSGAARPQIKITSGRSRRKMIGRVEVLLVSAPTGQHRFFGGRVLTDIVTSITSTPCSKQVARAAARFLDTPCSIDELQPPYALAKMAVGPL